MIDWSRCVLPPYDHQTVGVRALVGADPRGRANPHVLALFDDVGAGKSKQVVDAAYTLYDAGDIDTVLVVAPAFARNVWGHEDPVLGEVAKRYWRDVPTTVQCYPDDDLSFDGLTWIAVGHELVRRPERLKDLQQRLRGRRYWLVIDESWIVKTHTSKIAKACRALRADAQRVTLLNGTPITNNYLDLYSQMMILDPSILFPSQRPKTIGQGFKWFRGAYAVMGGYLNKEIVDWRNVDQLNALVAPYILRRETRECIDLPPILPPLTLAVPLDPSSWRVYGEMRDQMVAWLDSGQSVIAQHAIVRGLRLAQICAGFLGGLSSLESQVDLFDPEVVHQVGQVGPTAPKEIGREKLDALLAWLEGQTAQKLIIWCRFRAEVDRTARALAERHPRVLRIWGEQDPAERAVAVRSLAPDGDPDPSIVVAHPAAGGAALNLAGASLAVYLSNDFNYRTRAQADGRIDRPGQTQPVQYVDVVATGPKGQRTVDHHILQALRRKEDIATWSALQWRQVLNDA